MTLTDKERAAMVKDLRQIARNYHRLHSHTKDQSDASLALNYEALAEALAERKPFEAVAERLSKGEKMTTKTPQEYAAFLESLRVKNEGPEGRNWPEDYNRENGNYQNKCVGCSEHFIGHKRRVVCRVCSEGGVEVVCSV